MKPLFLALLCLPVFIFSCKKDADKPVDPPAPPPVTDIIKKENDRLAKVVPGETTDTYLSGIIMDEEGKPLSAVTVNCGTATVTTNNKGIFQFPNKLSVNKNYAILTASFSGYFKAIKTFTPNSSGKANHFIEIKLLKANAEKTVAATGGNVILDNKINLTFPDGAVVTSNGAAYTGQYKVLARYIDPASDNFFATMPGLLAGLNDQDQILALQSFGMANVELKDMSGNSLQIKPGKTVKMILPAIAGAPATIPLWHFNEKYGLWIQAGNATKSGDSYTAEVNHFSAWNLDMDQNGFTLNLEFKNEQGKALSGLNLVAYTQSMQKISGFTTDNDGKATLVKCPASESLIVKTVFECDTITNTLSPLIANRNETIVLRGNSTLIKTYNIEGKLTGCDDLVLPNQPFLLSLNVNGKIKGISGLTDENGSYTLSTSICTPDSRITVQAFAYRNTEFLFAPSKTYNNTGVNYTGRVCDSTYNDADNLVVIFPDAVLELAIRSTIQKPTGDILYRDIRNLDSIGSKVTSFLDSSASIADLSGIEFCTNLRKLRLLVHNTTDLSPLQNLHKLEQLSLISYHASTVNTDVSFLQSLTALKNLELSGFNVVDVSAIKDLIELQDLDLSVFEVADLSPLEGLVNLKSLRFLAKTIADIDFLKNLRNLEHVSFGLSMQFNEISLSNYSFLQNVPKLKTLTISGGGINDISYLQNLPLLEVVSLPNNKITDLTPLKYLTGLKQLDLGNNKFADISPLKGLTKLETLFLSSNKITDVSHIKDLIVVHTVYLNNNMISDISSLTTGLPEVFFLHLSGQNAVAIPQSQRDAFAATHPITLVVW